MERIKVGKSMKTDGRFGIHVAQISAKYGHPINLFALGDIHRNSPNHAIDKWYQDLDRMKKLQKKEPCFYIYTGDLLEYLSSSERRFFVSGGFHDSTTTKFERDCISDVDTFCQETDFQRGRVVSIYGGNHYFQFADGTTSDMAIAAKLRSHYIGCSGYTVLSINIDDHHNHCVKIFSHHGTGGGKKVGSSFNGLEDASSYFSDADIILMGHNHQLGVAPISSIRCDRGKGDGYRVKAFDRWLGRTGSYLKSYEPDTPSYPVDSMMRPSRLGCLQFILTPTRRQTGRSDRTDDRWIDIKAVV